MDGYVENVNFCEYCGNILNEDGRCPDEECVYNLLLDVMSDTEEEEPVEVEEEHQEDPVEEDTDEEVPKDEPSEGDA